MVMPKVLILPLLQIPSGHHQVADAMSRWLTIKIADIEIEKIEILSYFNRIIERMVSQVYLKWIDHFPRVYDWLYRFLSYHPTRSRSDVHKGYELLFVQTMRKLIAQSDPDLIICTHALPSYLCSRLKMSGQITQPVVNVYTDFFVNQLWGIEGIDLHFAPSSIVKEGLMQQKVKESSIYVTGIPVDVVFHQEHKKKEIETNKWHILIAGGSIGVGIDPHFYERLMMEERANFTILCGKNEALYEQISQLESKHIHPLHYITSRDGMKQLYDQMDAIVTKPGGVTITEALFARLPIFIHTSLPGQEEINRDFLFKEHMAYPIDLELPLGAQLHERLSDPGQRSILLGNIDRYRMSLEWESGLAALIDLLEDSNTRK